MTEENKKEVDTVDVDVDENDDDTLEIEVVDDVSEDDRPRRELDAKVDIPDDSDLEDHSEKVQKRIKQLTFEAREAARQQAESARLRDEAIQAARELQRQNEELRKRAEQGQTFAVNQAKDRAQAQFDKAKADYVAAHEAGDSEALIDAQQRMNNAQYDLNRFSSYRPRQEQPQPQPQPQQRQHQPQQPPQLSERQRTWMENNKWFGDNRRMTAVAMAAHDDLVQQGVDPDSETYYREIDKAVREVFPNEFGDGAASVEPQRRKAQTVVAPAARTNKGPRKIKLTATQVKLAKRLGLTPEQYATQLVKEQANG